jgi:O-succinylbenzoate synthase
MIEQPLAHDDIVDHARLQSELATPICLDESIHSAADARRALDLGSCRMINIKTGRMGGHRESLAVHDLCLTRDIAVWCGGMLESGIGRLHNVALASLPGFALPGDTSASNRYFAEDIVDPPVTLSAGTVAVPQEPGLGHRVRTDLIDRLTTDREEFRARSGPG